MTSLQPSVLEASTLSVCLSVCPSVCPSVRPSVRLSVRLSVRRLSVVRTIVQYCIYMRYMCVVTRWLVLCTQGSGARVNRSEPPLARSAQSEYNIRYIYIYIPNPLITSLGCIYSYACTCCLIGTYASLFCRALREPADGLLASSGATSTQLS